MALTDRAHPTSQFHFKIENSESFLVKSFEGGLPKGNTIEEPIGTTVNVVKHLSTFEIEPLSIEMGMQDGVPMLEWIRRSWKQDYSRQGGSLTLADFNLKSVREYSFANALITETTFPTLDAAGKDAGTLKVKIQPETAALGAGDNQKIVGQSPTYQKQKLWNASCFSLDLTPKNGTNLDTSRVNKIDSFTVKQGVKAYNTGRERFASWEPTKLTFPDISVHMSLVYADSMIAWYQKTCMVGDTDPSLEADGTISYLSPDLGSSVFDIQLYGVGVKGMTIDKAERGDAPRRVKFDLYVGWMDISTSGVLAF